MNTPDEAREELSAIVLDHFHSPDALHSTWWIRPAETADAILAAGYRKQGPVSDATRIALDWFRSESAMWLAVGSNYERLRIEDFARSYGAFREAGGGTYAALEAARKITE